MGAGFEKGSEAFLCQISMEKRSSGDCLLFIEVETEGSFSYGHSV